MAGSLLQAKANVNKQGEVCVPTTHSRSSVLLLPSASPLPFSLFMPFSPPLVPLLLASIACHLHFCPRLASLSHLPSSPYHPHLPFLYQDDHAPLHFAALKGHKEVSEMLIQANANVDVKNSACASSLRPSIPLTSQPPLLSLSLISRGRRACHHSTWQLATGAKR